MNKKKKMNVLWIMSDQLRYDYLSCYGATHIHTPNIDWLASQGVRFDKAYVQSPVCGPSRMSSYTGRYSRSHGACWNGFALSVGEPTLGDHMRELGVKCELVGKTHAIPDKEGMARIGISPDSVVGKRLSEAGFDVVIRDDGTNHSENLTRHAQDYDDYLRSHGMDGENPWEEWANSAYDEDGNLVTGWLLKNAHLPARVPKEHSESAWLTTRGIEYIEAQGDEPWLCHLSYIKPHWPYMAPAPYHNMYSADDLPPVNRSDAELQTTHPLLKAWTEMRVSRSFTRDKVRERVAPVYMGLIKELDDQLGRLFDYLRSSGRMEDTMIIFCSDHGDNMGDHGIGEKDLFYDCSARIPLIIYDPREQADATRGTVNSDLVESIDLVPTFISFYDGAQKPHILEGRSLEPLLHGVTVPWRDYCVSEYDYATRDSRVALEFDQADARLVMIFDGRWKYVHVEHMRPLLYDLQTDPDELNEIGDDPRYASEIDRLRELHFAWTRQHHRRITKDAETVEKMTEGKEPPGIIIGYWDESELAVDNLRVPPHLRG